MRRSKDVPSPDPSLSGFVYSPDFSRFLTNSGDDLSMWDCAARSPIIAGTFPRNRWAPGGGEHGTIYGLSGQ
jgi:hypothetical protein